MFLKNKMLRLFKIISVLLANLRQNQHTRNNRSSPTRVFTLCNKTVWGKKEKAENTQKNDWLKILLCVTTVRTDCSSGSIDRWLLGEAVFHLSSILIYASMTMRAWLRGAVGGSSARLCAYEPLYLQMCAAELRAWFPRAPSRSRTRME